MQLLLSPWILPTLLVVGAVADLVLSWHEKKHPKWPALVLFACAFLLAGRDFVKEREGNRKAIDDQKHNIRTEGKIDALTQRFDKFEEMNLRFWTNFSNPTPQKNPTDTTSVRNLFAGQMDEERKNFPSEMLRLEQETIKNPSLTQRISLADAFLRSGRFAMAREQFEIIAMGNYDSNNRSLGELLARTIRAGYGKELAVHSLQPAWLFQWDQITPPGTSVTAKALIRTYTNPNWEEVLLQEPVGSVIRHGFSTIRSLRIRFGFNSNGLSTPEVRSKSIIVRLVMVDQKWRIHDPALLGPPTFLGIEPVDRY